MTTKDAMVCDWCGEPVPEDDVDARRWAAERTGPHPPVCSACLERDRREARRRWAAHLEGDRGG